MEDKIEEQLEKMWSRRQVIWNDLKIHGHTLSAVSQVALIAEVARIDVYMSEMEKQLEDMGWQDFIRSAWGNG